MTADSPRPIPEFLVNIVAAEMGAADCESFNSAFGRLDTKTHDQLIELLEELASHSPKSAAAWSRKFNAAAATFDPAVLLAWTDLIVALAGQSATAALRTLGESVELICQIPSPKRRHALSLALEMADEYYSVLPDFMRTLPAISRDLGAEALSRWAELGGQLTARDAILGVEYFRISAAVTSLVGVATLPLWVELGMRLVGTNPLGKPDYLPALEYFRLSPDFLAGLPEETRSNFLALTNRIATASAPTASEFIRQAPGHLARMPADPERVLVLGEALKLSEIHPGLVPDFLSHSPEILSMTGGSATGFRAWVTEGLTMARDASGGLERAQAYFSRRTRAGLEAPDRLMGAVSLASVQRSLTLFGEALSGRPIRIRPRTERPSGAKDDGGRTIWLPERVSVFSNEGDNFRVLKIATLHEVGHIEFGSYDLDLAQAEALFEPLRAKYGNRHPVRDAETYFALFPDPALARRLWEIVEDSRIDARLRNAYPGARREMDRLIAQEIAARPNLSELPVRTALMESLTQISMTDTTEAPLEIAALVAAAYEIMKPLKHPTATALDALGAQAALYFVIDSWLSAQPKIEGETNPFNLPPVESDSGSGGGKRLAEIEAPSFRGKMAPDWSSKSEDRGTPGSHGAEASRSDRAKDGLTAPGPAAAQSGAETGEADSRRGESTNPATAGEASFHYDEWDYRTGEYRPRWVKVLERPVAAEPNNLVAETFAQYGPIVSLLRRHFQALRPESLRRARRQAGGDEIDLDALIEARADRRAGQAISDRLYIRTEKRERDVAAAFLVDLSGSTNQHLGHGGRRVIDLERQGLILLISALEAIGDEFAIYGFSGENRYAAEFYVIKEFSDGLRLDPSGLLAGRIGALKPRAQNRDGAAIRHAAAKLAARGAKTRLLILLSDGKPLDTDYNGLHAIWDTRVALREARALGIHPYCITIDRTASDYLGLMYGDVSYTIIDRIETLPERLPRIYRRLTA